GLASPASPASPEDSAQGSSGSIVETAAGKIRGGHAGGVAYFKGVHYGASTAGAARFQPPVKVEPWTGVRDALHLGTRAPQGPSGLIPEVAAVDDSDQPIGEDCLCLNVWTPRPGHAGKRPVMVWLHGGGFSSGSGGFKIYDGTHLAAKHDVVVVTVNHRLNAFGFLFLPDIGGARYAQASNVGMLDIVLALEWVRDNAAAFGGDPGNVTIFGQSGGGAKVSTLMAMPAAQGLYHRAIVMSGSSIDGVARDAANESTAAFLSSLGLPRNAAGVEKLQSLSMEQVLAAADARNRAFRMAPVVDGRTLPANPFDPVAPRMSAGVPLLVGSTQDEVGFFNGFPLDPISEAELAPRLKGVLHADDATVRRVIEAYRKDQPGIAPIDIVDEVASDMFAWTHALMQAERKAALGAAPVFMYYFKWESPVRGGKLKAFHTLDIPFVFDNVDVARSMTGTGRDRYALERRMSSAWAAFARNGNPNTPELPHWPAFDSRRRATLFLDDTCGVVEDPRRDERLVLTPLSAPRGA
ncbi:MAG: carboxylesterase/lipase family protein, partial [Steroidobacteraceae bacterium]